MKKILFILMAFFFFSACEVPSIRSNDPKQIYPIEPLHKALAVSTATLLNWNIPLETESLILYDLYLSTDPKQLSNDTTLDPIAFSLKEHFYYPPQSFLPKTTYYWRVMAHIPTKNGNEAVFSPLFQFTTGTRFEAPARYHLLTVGISDYNDGTYFKNLTLPDEDAKDALRIFSKFNEPWQLHSLIGEVNRENFLVKLQQILSSSTSNDLFAFHYAGHGIYIPEQATSLLVFSSVEQTNHYPTLYHSPQTLSVKELKAQLDRFVGKKWAFIDCCQSGAFVEMGKTQQNALNSLSEQQHLSAFSKAFLAPFEEQKSDSLLLSTSSSFSNTYFIFTATKIDEDAYEHSRIKNGIFSFSLFDALGDASSPNLPFDFSFNADRMPFNHQIHFNELKWFIPQKVNALLKEFNFSDKKMTVSFYPTTSCEILTSYFPSEVL